MMSIDGLKKDSGHTAAGPRRTVVFLVNDQKMIGEAVRRMLAGESDIDFHFCEDPLAAVKIANEIHPTVILQDLIMPGVDGLTIVRDFRDNPATADVPIIVLSSEENTSIKADAFAADANDYLTKIPDKTELLARLRHHSRGYIRLLEHREANDTLLKSQKGLIRNEIMYHKIFKNINIAILVFKEKPEHDDFIIIDINKAMTERLHVDKAAIVCKNLSESPLPFRDGLAEALLKLIQDGKPLDISFQDIPFCIFRLYSGEIIVAENHNR